MLLVGREPDPPYNRPPLSKGYLRGKESLEDALFRPDEWWDEQDDRAAHPHERDEARRRRAGRDALQQGRRCSFDKALLATGANVRRLQVDGGDLDGIHYLRAIGNSDAIREDAASAERVGADRRQLHRHRGGGVADGGARRAVRDRDAWRT